LSVSLEQFHVKSILFSGNLDMLKKLHKKKKKNN